MNSHPARGAGTHWPANAGGEHPNRRTILRLPGSAGLILILADSARFWWAEVKAATALAVWRGLPRPEKLPAMLGWDAKKVAAECVNLWDEAEHSGTEWFTPLNELQFVKESGHPFAGYADMTAKLARLRPALRAEFSKRGQDVKILFPAWVPSDDGTYLDEWRGEAEQWDGLVVHCYGSAETMQARYASYHAAFPGMPIVVGEWNSNHEGHDERESLQMWADLAAVDPHFLGAAYYIWETNNAGEHDLSAWGNDDRLALFLNPPLAAGQPVPEPVPIPEPEPTPMYRVPTWTPAYEHIRDGAIQVADEAGLPRRRLLGLCLAESGVGLQSFDRWASTERSNRMVPAINAENWPAVEAIFSEIAGGPTNDISFGPCHQSWWWSLTAAEQQAHPEWRHDLTRIMEFRAHLIEDHGAALRLAAGKIAGAGDDLETLALYNKPDGSASAGVRANYQRSLVEADRILAAAPPAPPAPPADTVYEPYPDPEPAGTIQTAPLGVIFHGSRSGKAGNPLDAEYSGTANYEVNNTLGLGWNATCGPGKVAIHMDAHHWGWNARAASSKYIGVEIAQPTVNDPLPDNVATALADYIFDHVWPAWGELWHFPSHSELDGTPEYGGTLDGKSDLYPRGDIRMDAFREKVYARLKERKGEQAPAPPPTSTYSVGPGILAAMSANGDVPATDEIYVKAGTRDAYSEAYGQSGARYVYIVSLNRTFRYAPAA